MVKLALLEFGISEMKSNYSLYKVTVKVNMLLNALSFIIEVFWIYMGKN